MKLFLALLALVVVAVVIVLILAARKPDDFSMERSLVVDAEAERLFPLIDDLRAHESWSPFDKPDPAVTKTYTGAPSGTGAVYEWSGKGQSGSGRLAITASVPASQIVMQLDMLQPMKTTNTVIFTLAPVENGTKVTWAMHGKTPYLAKIFHVFMDMDRMVGGQFEAGLLNLKTISERNR